MKGVVRILIELELGLDEGLKGGMEVGHAHVNQLRNLSNELSVHSLVQVPGLICFLFSLIHFSKKKTHALIY